MEASQYCKQAQEAMKKMYRVLPQWKLEDCIAQLCGDTSNLIGATRASHVYFANKEVAEAAARTLAELMGGVMDVSKSCPQRLRPLRQPLRKVPEPPSSLVILKHKKSKMPLKLPLTPMRQHALHLL